MIKDVTFANPELFYFLLLIPVLIGWYIFRHKQKNAALNISSFNGFNGIKTSAKIYLRHSLFVLRMFALALLIVAIARPQSKKS